MNITIDKGIQTAFSKIQERKGKGKWMIVKYNEKDGSAKVTKLVMKEEKEDEDEVLETFIKEVKEADPCWAFIEYKDTIFFVSYVSGNAKAKQKMPMAFNRKKFKESFEGIKVDMECTDPSEVEPSEFKKKVKKIG